MEILSIITERPDRLALCDIGSLPTKHLEQTGGSVTKVASQPERLIRVNKDEKGRETTQPTCGL